MVDSRQKGASYERSIVRVLNDFAEENALEFTCQRNLNQYQQSGQVKSLQNNQIGLPQKK